METAMSEFSRPHDAIRELATQIYIGLVCRVYGDAGRGEETRQSPEALARTSLKLAEAFHLADGEVNPITIATAAATAAAAASEAAAKRSIGFDASDLDLGSLHAQR
jgi:hypothetical protein